MVGGRESDNQRRGARRPSCAAPPGRDGGLPACPPLLPCSTMGPDRASSMPRRWLTWEARFMLRCVLATSMAASAASAFVELAHEDGTKCHISTRSLADGSVVLNSTCPTVSRENDILSSRVAALEQQLARLLPPSPPPASPPPPVAPPMSPPVFDTLGIAQCGFENSLANSGTGASNAFSQSSGDLVGYSSSDPRVGSYALESARPTDPRVKLAHAGPSSFTFAFWWKSNSSKSPEDLVSGGVEYIFSTDGGLLGKFGCQVDPPGSPRDNAGKMCCIDAAREWGSASYLCVPFTWTVGEWRHYAFTVSNNADLRVYENGQLYHSFGETAGVAPLGLTTTLFATQFCLYTCSYILECPGLADNFYFTDTALSAADVAGLYQVTTSY